MRRTILLLALAIAPRLGAQAAAAAAPADPGAAYRERLAPLQWLVGEWEGTGWYATREGRFTFAQHETVRLAAGGAVLVIDGLGTGLTPEASRGKPVHQAFASIAWDAASRGYRMTAVRYGGDAIVETPEVAEGRWVWGMAVAGGRTRFTIERTPAGEWHEVGDFSRDGQQWSRFIEFSLKKRPD